MAYTMQSWNDDDPSTPISAARLTHIEQGIVAAAAKADSPTVDPAKITGATAVGRSVLTAKDAATARSAIGAGTSSLALGTTATTAMPGNTPIPAAYTLPAATTAALGGVKQAAAQADSKATDIAGLLADFNALLAKLRAAGILGS